MKIIMMKKIWIESTNKTLHSISQPDICVELLMLTTLSLELQKKPRFQPKDLINSIVKMTELVAKTGLEGNQTIKEQINASRQGLEP